MKKLFVAVILVLPLLVFSQADSILSGKYSWKKPSGKMSNNIRSSVLFEGKVVDMSYLQMTANTLVTSNVKAAIKVPVDEEQLMLIKAGEVLVSFRDSTWKIGAGSIVLFMPGENYILEKRGNQSMEYYLMKYRSKSPVDLARGKKDGGSFVKNWNDIPFRAHDKGGIRNYFQKPTAMSKRFEMHVTTLNEGLKSHEPHTHRAEEIVLVIENKTEMQINDKFYKGKAGDIYYLGSNVSHAIRNIDRKPCTYFAFQFE